MQVQAVPAVIMPSLTSTSSTHTSNSARSVVSSTPARAFSPENDPHPSWMFFPPAASYILHPTSEPSPTATSPTRPSASSTRTNSKSTTNSTLPSSTPSTHHRILDHCFHLSIETRLKQAEAQYLASTQEQAVEQQIREQQEQHQPPISALKQDDWRRRQRSLVDEAVVLGRKGSNVEAIVDGILKSHRSSGPLQTLPRHLKHRLHLCQLTSMVFGRFDVASSTNNSAGLNIYSAFHSRRHGASRAAIQHHLANSPQGQKTRAFFAQPIHSSSYCRRHHRKDCQRTCCTLAKMQQQQQQALEQKKKMTNSYYMNHVRKPEQQRVAGLVDAIPAFLKCSAMSYRDIATGMVEKGEHRDLAETHVLEGWYRLLLEMMTQAVIESYLCDGTVGVDTLLDVFSYGDEPEADDVGKEVGTADESSKEVPAGVEHLQFNNLQGQGPPRSHSTTGNQQQQQQQSALQDTITQDRQDDILFVKTPEYESFKSAKDERLQEFLTLRGTSVEQHFIDLATKYPVTVFERQMTHYISRSQKLLVDPKLSRSAEEIGLLIPPATSAYADGSLSMPVSDDEDEDVMEEVSRLEEIKEEEDDQNASILEQREDQQQQQQQQTHSSQRTRHEKMRLATITTSVEDAATSVDHSKKSPTRVQHLPSPPPSVAVSRSSTVSPLTMTASLSEEDESIAEAARILMSNNSSSKKHKLAEVKAEPQDESANKALGHAAKKVKA
ncbi:hypothetical protein BGZ75_002628 [Mortierella antarctica]|nr:hypothetical protein BGZ75_002628 [Mortierella antarctica]